eukprot:5358288-Amphidinium_carterae.1
MSAEPTTEAPPPEAAKEEAQPVAASAAPAADDPAAPPSQQKETVSKVEMMKRGLKTAKTMATESGLTVRERSSESATRNLASR